MRENKISVLTIVKGLDIGAANGGAERFGLELARSLNQEKFHPQVFSYFTHQTPAETFWREKLESEGIPVIMGVPWHGNDHFGSYLQGFQILKRNLPVQRIDICHSHFQLGTLSALALKLSSVSRIAVRTVHLKKEWSGGFYGFVRQQLISGWIYPLFVNGQVGVSREITLYLEQQPGMRFTRQKPRLIHNAVNLDVIKAKGALSGLPRGIRIFIGTAGRLTEQKGITYLLQAMPQVIQSRPDVCLVIAGDGELRPELERQRDALHLEDNVVFTGHLAEVGCLLNQLSLFVLPSLWEGFPTVVLESMACGVPVVATNIPGTQELIRDNENGWLVPPGDPGMLARAILHGLHDEPKRKHFIASGRLVAQRFSIQNIAKEYEELYLQLTHDKN